VDNTLKPLSRLLLLILVYGLSLPASSVSGARTPSVPVFTVNLVAYPYDVPSVTTTSIDQYTGEEIVNTTPGYRVENRSIEITIKNQPFTPYTDADGNEINLYYNVRAKGHFGDNWEELYSFGNPSSTHPIQSSSEYTILSLPANYPDGAQVDFQVEARLGYYYNTMAGHQTIPMNRLASAGSSGWSSTQTLTIDWNNAIVFGEPEATGDTETPDTSTTSDDTITSDETTKDNEQGTLDVTWVPNEESSEVEEFVALLGIAILVAALAVGLVCFKMRKS
jgi:hypothetical protein